MRKYQTKYNLFSFISYLILHILIFSSSQNVIASTAGILTTDLQSRILSRFESGSQIATFDNQTQSWSIVKQDKILGYVFESKHQVDIPAYSGKPINLLITINTEGVFKDAWVLEHHEPILLVGIPEEKLQQFSDQYSGKSINDKIRVGSSSDPSVVSVDAITGATVTVLVVNQTILKAARKMAIKLGLIDISKQQKPEKSTIKHQLFTKANWDTLTGDGSIRKLLLTRKIVDEAFIGTEAEGIETASLEQKNETFIELYYTYLNAPTVGKNLLGESEYQWLMSELKNNEHAIAIMGNGLYSFKGSGYVRGGIFDRIALLQDETDINFRDLDYYRLNDIYPEGAPSFKEMAIFIIREHQEFDPGLSWDLELLVRRQTGPLDSAFVSFSGSYQIPETYINRPAPIILDAEEEEPVWISIWKQKIFQIVVLCISLLLLMTVIFLQDWLVKYPKFLHSLRRGFLIYTVFFIGWYTLGQLSIVNVFTFAHAYQGDFRWELFLMDPVIFILWGFTAATILLWGRGIFCGWLCPFGALQELINELARKLKIKQFELPFIIHEKLWAIKYLILLALFGISLESMATAEKLAEVEPFKTTILMAFQREWWFVTYAVMLLFVSIFTRKVYCRYICPLGAALAIPTKLRLFDWLKRRPECGKPCQLCAKECEIHAIHPDGTINANECHHCLDCQVTYNNAQKCPPLVNKGKKRKRRDNNIQKNPQSIEITSL